MIHLQEKVEKYSQQIKKIWGVSRNTIRILHPEAFSMRRRLQAGSDTQSEYTKY